MTELWNLKMYSVGRFVKEGDDMEPLTQMMHYMSLYHLFRSIKTSFIAGLRNGAKDVGAYQNLQVPAGIKLVPDPSERVSHVNYGWLSLLVTPPLDISSD